MKAANQNQHIEDYLDAYRQMADTDFAVMITGPWGCGKSHFIKNRFTESDYIYVSLNGVTDLANIDAEVFKAVYPVVGWKSLTFFGRLFNETLKAWCRFNLADAIRLSDFKAKIGGRVLVFDDFERCLLKPERTLGYINSYVEKKTKVVIIGEEDYINRQSNEKYRLIKEKVIGKTFRLSENIENLFGALVTDKSYPVTHTLIVRNRDSVIQMFKKICEAKKGQCNYRALKHSLRDFEFFYPNIDAGFRENTDFLDQLLKVFVTLDYEVQLANLTAEDIERGPSDEEDDEGHKTESKYAVVLNRHGLQDPDFMVEFSTVVFQRETWASIFRNVDIDKDVLSETIRNSKYFPKNQPEWVVLWHWRSLDDGVAADALAKVRDKVKKHAYCTREEILHVFSILTGLAGLGAVPETKEELVLALKSYLDVLLTEKRLVIPPYGFRDVSLSGSHGLGYWTENTEDHAELAAVIRDALEKAVAENTEESVAIWLNQVGEFPGQFYPKLEMNAEFFNKPILHMFPPDLFLTAITKVPNETKWALNDLLIKRFSACRKERAAELPFLEGIVQELDKRIAGCGGPSMPTMTNLKYLRDQLTKILPSFREMATAKGVDSPSPVATIET